MTNKLQLTLLIVILIALGVGITIYKVQVLGFSFNPDSEVKIWTVESRIDFKTDGGPIKISLNLPDNYYGLTVTESMQQASNYEYSVVKDDDGVRRAVWSSKNPKKGPQHIYYRATIYRHRSAQKKKAAKPVLALPSQPFKDSYLKAADNLIKATQNPKKSVVENSVSLINALNAPEKSDAVTLLLDMPRETGDKLNLARDLLLKSKIPCRLARGLVLNKKNNKTKLAKYIEIFDGKKWQLINPKTADVENQDTFLLWQRHNESLVEIEGGSNAKVRFSSIESRILANNAAIKGGHHKQSWLVNFSIYSLPLSSQNTFKLLLLIPFGALIVVILRNLVGIQTSGTFMPILIALSFLQTTLLVGLALFIIVVCVGLMLRSLLSHLNLLLVPRISAILVFVIIIYLAISVIGFKMGSELGLNVTFFPMIIISWSIERMCVLWEEEGGKDVLIQGSGSLFTASVIYLFMKNSYIGNMTYAFPELLLVLLAIILMIGTYSGYRLSELRRFEPMGQEQEKK